MSFEVPRKASAGQDYRDLPDRTSRQLVEPHCVADRYSHSAHGLDCRRPDSHGESSGRARDRAVAQSFVRRLRGLKD